MNDQDDNPQDSIDEATLLRYLNGVCGPAELARVERWLAADPANRSELAVLSAAWNPPPLREADEGDQMWQSIAARMDAPLSRPRLARTAPAARSRRPALVAAALLLGAVGALAYELETRSRPAPYVAATPSAPARELVTSRGQRATGYLPDGSRVILGPDTRLSIPATFAATQSLRGMRDVHLQGEAFFAVTHDSTRPFRVHTSNGVAEDLGTEFVVTAYPETRTTRVVVASGVVALRKPESGPSDGHRSVLLTLEAGDLGRIDAIGTATLTRNVDLAAYVDWTKGTLVFDGAPVRDAVARLARWYDIEIRLTDSSLADRRFTARFNDEPVARVLRVLEIALDVRAEQSGQVVILRPVPAKRPRTGGD